MAQGGGAGHKGHYPGGNDPDGSGFSEWVAWSAQAPKHSVIGNPRQIPVTKPPISRDPVEESRNQEGDGIKGVS